MTVTYQCWSSNRVEICQTLLHCNKPAGWDTCKCMPMQLCNLFMYQTYQSRWCISMHPVISKQANTARNRSKRANSARNRSKRANTARNRSKRANTARNRICYYTLHRVHVLSSAWGLFTGLHSLTAWVARSFNKISNIHQNWICCGSSWYSSGESGLGGALQ